MKYLIGTTVAAFLVASLAYAEDVVIDFYHMYPPGTSATADVVQSAVTKFQAEHPDVSVKVLSDPHDGWQTKIKAMLASGQLPSIFVTQPSDFQQFRTSGLFQSLDEVLAADAEWKNSFATGALNTIAYDGTVYGVPFSSYLEGIFYNRKIFSDAGIEFPKTWDELTTAVDTLVEKDIVPFAMGAKSGWVPTMTTHFVMDREMGYEYYVQSLSDQSKTWDNPEYIRAFDRIVDLANRGAFGDNALANSQDDARSLFLQGKAAMFISGTWDVQYLVKPELGPIAGDIGFANFVTIPDGLGDQTSITRGYGKSFAVRSGLPDAQRDASIDLLKALANRSTALELLERGGILAGNEPPQDVEPKIPPLLKEALSVGSTAKTTWPAYGESMLPGFYDELNRMSQRLVGGAIDGATAAAHLERARVKFHFGN